MLCWLCMLVCCVCPCSVYYVYVSPSRQVVEKKAMFRVSKGLSCVYSGLLVWGSDSPVNDELSTYTQYRQTLNKGDGERTKETEREGPRQVNRPSFLQSNKSYRILTLMTEAVFCSSCKLSSWSVAKTETAIIFRVNVWLNTIPMFPFCKENAAKLCARDIATGTG